MHNPFNIPLNSFYYYFVENIGAHQGYWPIIFFSCGVLTWLCCKFIAGLVNEFGTALPSSIFLEQFEKNGINSSLNVWQALPISYLIMGFSLLGGFSLLIQYPYSY